MEEKVKKTLLKSDKSLSFMKSFIKNVFVILTVIFMIAAIVMWVYAGEIRSLKGLFVGLGFAFCIVGPLLCYLFYKIIDFKLWTAYDIKVIRTMVTKQPISEVLAQYSTVKTQNVATEQNSTTKQDE